MKSTNIARTSYVLLSLIVLCALAKADIRGQAPQFTAQALDGETFSSTSLSGKVVLLQFWATWCGYCRHDQPAVDNIERTYSRQGLVVIAVNVGESDAVVRKYLAESPRSCPVVLDDGLASQFGAHGFPYYVLIDREGNIAGTQSGSGGEASLRHLLSRAGLSNSSRYDTREVAGKTSTSSPNSSGAKVILVPRSGRTLLPTPNPKTLFIFANGERLEVDHYTIDAGYLYLEVSGQQRTVALSALDMKTTIAINHERGIDLKIPQNRSEVTLAF